MDKAPRSLSASHFAERSERIVGRDGEASDTLIWHYGKSPYQNDKYYCAGRIKNIKSQHVEAGKIEFIFYEFLEWCKDLYFYLKYFYMRTPEGNHNSPPRLFEDVLRTSV